MSVLLLIVGVVLLIGLVVIHEFGHFVAARRSGVKVEEFGIFFPPRLYKRTTKSGWLFSINVVPLGGFVRLKGEHDSDTEPGSFGAAGVWAKTKIMAAGVMMNLVMALVLFTVIALIGMPKLVDNQFTVQSDTKLISHQVLISYVEPGSPAAKAGLQAEDQLNDITLSGYSPVGIGDASDVSKVTKSFAGRTAVIFYSRAGHQRETHATLRSAKDVEAAQKAGNPVGYLGVVPNDFTLQRSTWSAPVTAAGLAAQLTVLTFQGLGHALGGLGSLVAGAVTGNHTARENGQTAATDQVAGPVGIFVILKNGSLLGYQFMLFIIAYISLMLAIMNILPIPALDGGRLWLTLISRGLKKPLSARREEAVNATGFVVLLVLIILITIVDVKRYF